MAEQSQCVKNENLYLKKAFFLLYLCRITNKTTRILQNAQKAFHFSIMVLIAETQTCPIFVPIFLQKVTSIVLVRGLVQDNNVAVKELYWNCIPGILIFSKRCLIGYYNSTHFDPFTPHNNTRKIGNKALCCSVPSCRPFHAPNV